eukprot:4634909-Pyramimonas_sp.AAC.1
MEHDTGAIRAPPPAAAGPTPIGSTRFDVNPGRPEPLRFRCSEEDRGRAHTATLRSLRPCVGLLG